MIKEVEKVSSSLFLIGSKNFHFFCSTGHGTYEYESKRGEKEKIGGGSTSKGAWRGGGLWSLEP